MDDSTDAHYHLRNNPENAVEIVPLSFMKGLRSDQVLASEAFDWLIDADDEAEFVLKRASLLDSKGSKRNEQEEAEYHQLIDELPNILLFEGKTHIERRIESDRFLQISESIRALKAKLYENDN